MRFISTSSLKIDNNPPEILIGLIISFFLLTALFIFFYSNKYWIQKNSSKLQWLSLIILFFSPPFLSNDVFSYLYYGYNLIHGQDPYAIPDNKFILNNPFSFYVSELYINTPSVYGPISNLFFAIASLFQSVWISLIVIKLINLFSYMVIYHIFKLHNRSIPFSIFSLILIECIGQGHNDLWAISFLIISIHFSQIGQSFLSALFLVFMLMTKILYLPLSFIPFILLFQQKRKIIPFSLSVIILNMVWYFLWKDSIIIPLISGFNMRISGGWADIFHAFFNFISLPVFSMNQLSGFFNMVAVILVLGVSIYYIIKRYFNFNSLVTYFTIIIFIFYFIFISRIFSWYLLFLIPFAFLNLKRLNNKYLLLGVLTFISQGVIHQFAEVSILRQIFIGLATPITMVLLTIGAIVVIKENFKFFYLRQDMH